MTVVRNLKRKPVMVPVFTIAFWSIVWAYLNGSFQKLETKARKTVHKASPKNSNLPYVLAPPVTDDEVFDDPQWRGESFG